MKIYFVRHGESDVSGNDNKRPLSHKGKADIQRLANFIKPLNIEVSKIIQSNKMRAKQTAEILSTSISFGEIATSESLNPETDPNVLLHELQHESQNIMLVSHMPFLGRLISLIVTGHENKNIVAIKTGTMLCLEKIENEWMIGWMIHPDLL